MNTTKIKLSQINVNSANPRTIKDGKFDKLVTSLLVLPKMLELRPIVVDNTMTALGGNMRYRALCAIVDLNEHDIRTRLNTSKDFQAKTQAERDALVDYWLAWKDNPIAPVINASNLSDAEKREFIIKDNVSFGDWDYDALANEWESDDLNEWGVNVWGGNESDVNVDDYGEEFTLPDGDISSTEHMGFVLTNEQAELIREQLRIVEPMVEDGDTFGNANKNGNSIYKIVKLWADARR